jgi:HSP20 family protein
MASINLYDPFVDGVDDLFRGFFRPVRLTQQQPGQITIRVDVTENEGGYVVQAEIPGVRKDDIHVAIEGNQVTIGAEIKKESEAKDGERVLRTERTYGSAYRSFTLPVDLDETKSTARYENGILEIAVAKKPAVAGRKLAIQ